MVKAKLHEITPRPGDPGCRITQPCVHLLLTGIPYFQTGVIGALLVQHTAATEVMSLKVEFLLEPPKVWQQDIDTEVRKFTSCCISSKEST